MQKLGIADSLYEIQELPYVFDPSNLTSIEERSSLMGYLAVPTIGKYVGAQYNLQNPLFVLILPCQIRQNKCYYQQKQLNLPEEVREKLIYIQEMIKHNKPIKQSKPNKQDEEQKNHSPEYHPETFRFRPNFTFRFIISKNMLNSKNPPEFLNYVCHNYIFRHQTFEHTKRHVSLLPICMIPGDDNSGIYQWTKDQKSVSCNGLRSEYMSFHMKKGCPAFSPNNMKIGIQKTSKVLNFYTVLLTQLQYCVNYHWHFINDFETPIQTILKSTKSIKQLINFYISFKGQDGAVRELEKIFLN